jgi:zinc protease
MLVTLLAGCAHQGKGNLIRVEGSDFQVQKEVLPNGLTVILAEDHSVPVVSLSTWYRVGSAWETAGSTGIAHLFEHLMFKGTQRFPAHAFFDRLESRGANVNAFTERDSTVYYETIASAYLKDALELEADRMSALALSADLLESERKVVLEERRMRVDSDFKAQMLLELYSMAFPNHPYGVPVIGFEEDIKAINLDQCRSFYSTYYQPGNAYLAIAGDFKTSEVLPLIKKEYGRIKGKPVAPLALEPPEPLKYERRKVIYRPVESESLLLGYRIPEMSHPDIPALSTLSAVLFGLGSARAKEVLVREKQLAVGVGGEVVLAPYPSIFIITADLRAGFPVERVHSEMDALLDEVRVEPILSSELERVKRWMELSMMSETKSGFGLASLVLFGEYYWKDTGAVFRQFEQVMRLTVADLLRVARTYLAHENRVVVYMKPRSAK